jgi:hypothetical protein
MRLNAVLPFSVQAPMRAAPLLLFFLACDPPPSMEANPEVLWFRSREAVAGDVAGQVVREAAEQSRIWAAPLYVLSPAAFGGRHLIGHQQLYLREYETAKGRFRTVDPIDDRAMACIWLRRDLESLASWNRRFGARWDLQLGLLRAQLPGSPDEVTRIERAVCGPVHPNGVDAVDRRYDDRPR